MTAPDGFSKRLEALLVINVAPPGAVLGVDKEETSWPRLKRTSNFWRPQEYKYGFVTDIEQETVPPGLNEDVIRLISAKKGEPEWLLEWRLKAYRHWLTMQEPKWANVKFGPIDYQAIRYYSAPKQATPKRAEDIDPELLKTYDKLGIPLQRARAAGGRGGGRGF